MRPFAFAGGLALMFGVGFAAPACGDDGADALPLPGAEGGASSSSSSSGSTMPPPSNVQLGEACGYKGTGHALHVADGVDLCVPKTVCAPETCPPPLGDCVNGQCVYKNGYKGLETLPEAWATVYCDLLGQGCHGVTQVDFAEVTADAISKALSIPICQKDPSAPNCVGIAASSPMLVGNSQITTDPATGDFVKEWGLGLTEASGICYEVSGPGGTATVAFTDRCGGYCKCKGSGYQECGPCVSAQDMAPNCPCVGKAPSLHTNCCGNNCGVPVVAECDWCANNNHPHFDLDNASFAKVCGPAASAGSCRLTKVKPVACITPKAWPPGGGGASCKANSFHCTESPAPQQPKVPDANCCCNFGMTPKPDGSCG